MLGDTAKGAEVAGGVQAVSQLCLKGRCSLENLGGPRVVMRASAAESRQK